MNRLRRIVSVCMTAAALLLLASCASPKKFVYLNDMEPGKQYPVNTETVTIVHENDRLDIKVSCRNPELAVPFNSQVGAYRLSADGGVTEARTETVESGYRVDADGNIIFPILGKIKVSGKNLKQISDMIAGMITEGGYIRDPQVSIEFLNFKYTILGAARAGSYTVDGDRITILEAIANAGDLSNRARLDRIAVIRTVDGKQEIYYNDIRTADIFMSPTYYLQPNDIIYVEPRYRERSGLDNARWVTTTVSSLISFAAMIFSILANTGVINFN